MFSRVINSSKFYPERKLLMGNFAQEFELQNLQLLVLIHANNTVVTINGDKLTGLANVISMKYFDLRTIFHFKSSENDKPCDSFVVERVSSCRSQL